ICTIVPGCNLETHLGSIATHRGHTKTLYAANYDHARKLLRTLEKRRKARGYSLTESRLQGRKKVVT
ncbi:MAG TPA: hypothetical protein PL157_18550, partial [Acidobacteriota bacterium]|nr:hypothetical protein [Acidobacteriota bacterium]